MTTTTPSPSTTMHTTRRSDGWWIEGIPDSIDQCGPYDKRELAEHDMVGMREFFEHEDDPAFILGR